MSILVIELQDKVEDCKCNNPRCSAEYPSVPYLPCRECVSFFGKKMEDITSMIPIKDSVNVTIGKF